MMTKLCLIRDKIKKYFAKNQRVLMPVIKFVVVLLAMTVLTVNMNYMSAVSQWWIILAVAGVSTVLPWSAIAVAVSGYILVNFYAVSWEVMLVMACIYIIMICTYYMFHPDNAGLMLVITPVFIWFRLPFVPAIIMGVLGSVYSIIPILFGSIVYYVVMVVKDGSSMLALSENVDTTQRFYLMISRIFENKAMWLTSIAIITVFFVIYFVKVRKINYAREIAIITGAVAGIVIYLAGTVAFNIPVNIPVLAFSGIASVVIGVIANFSHVALDYSRVEYVQFEDDDYYYYVKAVPKINVTEPEFTVKRFDHKGQTEEKQTDTE